MLREIDTVLAKLDWMRKERIWPNGLRYLWTDAFGTVLLVSLYRELRDERYVREAEWVVAEVERVLGRPRGIRIGEEPDRDGQYFHYLAMWMYALHRLGTVNEKYQRKAIELVRQVHPAFVLPGIGVIWKMLEDLRGPYPGYGLGGLDHFHGYVVYNEIDPVELAPEIADMESLIERSYKDLAITQDLGLGMMLWFTHFRPGETWARLQEKRCLDTLDRMWVDEPGYFCREPSLRHIKFAFTNYGVSMGLQAVDAWPERVDKLNAFFDQYRSGDEYDRNAITHVMTCTSRFPGECVPKE